MKHINNRFFLLIFSCLLVLTAQADDLVEAAQHIGSAIDDIDVAVQSTDQAVQNIDQATADVTDALDTISLDRQQQFLKKMDSDRKERILARVAKIINGIFNIVRDPRDASNVGDNVSEMVGGIITIAVEAIKEKKENKKDIAEIYHRI